MSKKSKKILAYLMFVAALCGTPAVSEARGGSGGQVKTEKASASQRGGNLSQSFISYLIRNYGFEAAKWVLLGGGGFGAAKVSKVGNLDALAKYALGIKDADSKKLAELKEELNEEKKKLEFEKDLFEQNKAKALNDNTKLNNEKVALELKNNTLNAKVEENEQKIEELENSRAKLNGEVLELKNHNNQLLNLNNEDNRKIDALLWGYLPVKMSGELNIFKDISWRQNSYAAGKVKVDATPYSSNQGDVIVASAKYNVDGTMLGDPEWLTLKADELFGALAEKAGDGKLLNVSLKDIGLGYCGITCLARYSYSAGDDVRAFYFPLKSFQAVDNVENNENNGNANENNDINVENNENNEGNGN